MANVFFDIPVPTANGAGAAVDVSTMGKTKSFVIGGGFRCCVNIEYALDDIGTEWAPLATFLQSGNLTIDVAAHWLRAVTSEYQSGAPNVDVGGNDAGLVMATLTGDGASVDISTLPGFKTVIVPTGFVGTIDISEDGSDWAQVFSFQTGAAAGQSREFYGQFARVNPVGAALDVRIAGTSNDSGGGGGTSLWESTGPDPNHSVNTVISNVSPVGGAPTIVRVGPDPAAFLDSQLGVVSPALDPDKANIPFRVMGVAGVTGEFYVGFKSATMLGATATFLSFGDNNGGVFAAHTTPQVPASTPGTYDDYPLSESMFTAEGAGVITFNGWLPSGNLAQAVCPFVFFFNQGTANVVFVNEALSSDAGSRFMVAGASIAIAPRTGAFFFRINAPAIMGGTRWACIAAGV